MLSMEVFQQVVVVTVAEVNETIVVEIVRRFVVVGIQRKNFSNLVVIDNLVLVEVAIVSKACRGTNVEKGISFSS